MNLRIACLVSLACAVPLVAAANPNKPTGPAEVVVTNPSLNVNVVPAWTSLGDHFVQTFASEGSTANASGFILNRDTVLDQLTVNLSANRGPENTTLTNDPWQRHDCTLKVTVKETASDTEHDIGHFTVLSGHSVSNDVSLPKLFVPKGSRLQFSLAAGPQLEINVVICRAALSLRGVHVGN